MAINTILLDYLSIELPNADRIGKIPGGESPTIKSQNFCKNRTA
jgi:hypothetical protein